MGGATAPNNTSTPAPRRNAAARDPIQGGGVIHCTMRRALVVAPLLTFAVLSCGDAVRIAIPPPCEVPCGQDVVIDFRHVILTPGDTVRLAAVAKLVDGTESGVRWSAWDENIHVDSGGLVRAVSKGRTSVTARPAAGSGGSGVAEIWIVDPDTGGQPFLTGFRDARTGEPLRFFSGFEGRDSIALNISYVLGHSSETLGPPQAVLEIRRHDTIVVVRTLTFPLEVRGRGAMLPVTLHLTEVNQFGQRVLPSGAYDLFVLLPLANGERLGEFTGYRISF